jgi:hypothetical protein
VSQALYFDIIERAITEERERIVELAEKQIKSYLSAGHYFEADALKAFIETITKG